ncbi:autotransporter adhesin [Veillonella sp. ACP1]|uniref:autotransporter adhesin n=1 Tax=Veillonella sp. ACP1 TaxID=936588 RepID=UPI0002780170|nr:autotransporter adhesin [Veillonella sp. ACP1]EJO49653.1 YadA-like C-terminal domain protein [Veillonella sp. ACP1]
MNKIFKVVWSKTKECYVVVSEVAKNNGGKKKVLASVLAGLAMVGAGAQVQAYSGLYGHDDPSIETLAVGPDTWANQEAAVAIGMHNNANGRPAGKHSVAIGNFSNANGEISIAMGGVTNASGKMSVAVGYQASATDEAAVALGNMVSADKNSTGVGPGAIASGTYAFAGGYQSETTGISGVAIGDNAKAKAARAMAIGGHAEATAEQAIAIGSDTGAGNKTTASKKNAIAVGHGATASGLDTAAIGTSATASGQSSVALGNGTQSTNLNTTAIGSNVQSTKTGSIGIGGNVESIGDYSVAIGSASAGKTVKAVDYATAVGGLSNAAERAAALGAGANAAQARSVAIGYRATASTADGVAIGSTSVASTAAGVQGFNPADSRTNKYGGLTSAAQTSTLAAVSIGNGSAQTRQITGLAAGKEDTDAVNVAQLRSVNLKYAADTGNSDFLLTDGTLTVNGDGDLISTSVESTGAIKVTAKKGGNITHTDGKAVKPTTNGIATTDNVVDAINDSYWKATAGGNTDGTPSVGNVKPGTQVTYSAGDNLKVKQSINNTTGDQEYTYSLNPVLTGITSIANTAGGPTMTFGGNSINITGGSLNMGNSKITNLAPGTDDKDAVNLKQLKDTELHITPGTYTPDANKKVKLTYTDGNNTVVTGKEAVIDLSGLATGGTASTEKVQKAANGANDTNIAEVNPKTGDTFGDAGATYEVSVSRNAVKDSAREAVTVNNGGTTTGGTYTADTNNPISVTAAPDNANHNTTYAVTFDGNKAAKQIPLTYKATNGTTTTADQTVKLDKGLNFTGGDYTTASVGADGKVTFDVNLGTAPVVTDGKPGVPGQAGAAGKDGIATVKTVVDTINNSGWKANAKANGGTLVGNSTATVVKPGDQVNFAAGKNLTVKQDLTGEHTYTYSLNKDLKDLTSVEIGGSTIKTDGDHITITSPDTTTGAAPGATVTNKVANLGDEKHIKPDTYAVANDGSVTLKYVDGNGKDLTETTKITGIAKQDLSNITPAGETKIKNLAKSAINMEDGKNTKASKRDVNGVDTYKVDVEGDLTGISSITNGGTNNGKISFGPNKTVTVDGDHSITLNASTGKIGGLQNLTFDPTNFTSGQAATEDQLKSVHDTLKASELHIAPTASTLTNEHLGGTASGNTATGAAAQAYKYDATTKQVVLEYNDGTGANKTGTKAVIDFSALNTGAGASSWNIASDKVSTTEGTVAAGSGATQNIADGKTVTMKAGKNLTVKQENVGGNASVAFSLDKDLKDLDSVTTNKTITKEITLKDPNGGATSTTIKKDGDRITYTNDGSTTVNKVANLADEKHITPGTYSVDSTGKVTMTYTDGNNTLVPNTTTVIDGLVTKKLDNIDNDGKKTITGLGTIVKAGNNVTVSEASDATTGQKTYTVNAVTPAVYTKADGTKVVKRSDGTYTTNLDGSSGNDVAASDVIISFQDAAGDTKNATSIVNNVGSAIKNQTGGDFLTKLDNANTATPNAAVNVSDLKNTADGLTNKGLKFDANVGGVKTNKLGSTVKVQGAGNGVDADYSGTNIKTFISQTGDDTTIDVKLDKNLTGINSITGDTNSGKLVFQDPNATGNNGDAFKFTGGNINAGNNNITNLKSGIVNNNASDDKNGANIGDVKKIAKDTDLHIAPTAGTTNNVAEYTVDANNKVTLTYQDGNGTAQSGPKAVIDLSALANKITSGYTFNTNAIAKGGTVDGSASVKAVDNGGTINYAAGKNLTVKQEVDTTNKTQTYTYSLDKDINVETVTVTGQNGKDGKIGINGKDGVTRTISVEVPGQPGQPGTPGVDGTTTTRLVFDDKAQANLDDGMKYAGDDAQGTDKTKVIAKKLNETLDIIGGANKADLTTGNIGVNNDGNGKLLVQLSKKLKGLDSVQTKTVELGDHTTPGGTTNITYNTGDKRIEYTTPGATAGSTETKKVATTDDIWTIQGNGTDVAPVNGKVNVKAGDNVVIKTPTTADGSMTISAVTSAVYTKADGTKVYKIVDPTTGAVTWNTKADGTGTPVVASDVIVSFQDAAGNTTGGGSIVNNVGSAIDKTGTSTGNTFLTKLDTAANDTPNAAVNVKDLKTTSDALINKGLNFTGNNTGTENAHKLGSLVKVQGEGVAATDVPSFASAAGNIAVVANGTDTLEIKLNKNLKGINSVNNGSTSITLNDAPNATTPAVTIKGGNLSMGDGTTNGNNKIVNLAPGTDDNDAVNVKQLKAAKTVVAAGTNVTVNKTTGANGEDVYTVSATGGGTGTASSWNVKSTGNTDPTSETAAKNISDGKTVEMAAGKNLTVKQISDANGAKVEFALNKDLSNLDKIVVNGNDGATGQAGVSIVGPKGANGVDGNDGKVGITGKDGKDAVSISGKDGVGHIGLNGKDGANGISADIVVEKGKAGVDGKDGVDGITRIIYKDQDNNSHQVATHDDGMKFAGDDGQANQDTNPNVIKKHLNNVVDIIGGADKNKLTDNNIGVNNVNGKLKVQLSKEIDLTPDGKLTIGATTVDKNGVTIANGPSITKTGVDAGDKKITNVANGDVNATSKDAVNGSQLYQAMQDAKTHLDHGQNTTVSGTGTQADPYKVNVQGDLNKISSITNNAGDGKVKFDPNQTVTVAGDHNISLNGKTGDITGLTNVTIPTTPGSDFATKGRAATEEQLKQVLDEAKKKAVEKVQAGTAAAGDTNIAKVAPKAGDTFGTAGATYEVSVSKNDVKDAAKEAVKVTSVSPAITVTPDTSVAHETTYKVGFDGAEAAKSIPLTYKANGNGTQTVTLDKGLDFKNGTNTTARIAPNGQVFYDVNPNLQNISSISGSTTGNGPRISFNNAGSNSTVNIDGGNLNMGGNKITNIGKGTDPTDAARVGQLTKVTSNNHSVVVTKTTDADGAPVYDLAVTGTPGAPAADPRVDMLGEEIGRVGAQGAALSALKPIQYDPLEPTQIMAGYGNYRGNSALALGVAHYKNESTLIHGGVSWAGGSSHMMANAGVTWKVGNRDSEAAVADRYRKGPISSAYAMQQEMAAMKAQNAGLKGEVSDLKAENEQMKAQIAAMMAKLGL